MASSVVTIDSKVIEAQRHFLRGVVDVGAVVTIPNLGSQRIQFTTQTHLQRTLAVLIHPPARFGRRV